MIPLSFEGRFGWLHPAAGDTGVVLCAAHGFEALCVHKSWRAFAATLAEAGAPVLRFDYHGTGDSLGCDADPDRVATWRADIRRAVALLREQTSCRRVILVGLRLGATLAADIASEVPDLAGLVLLAPVTSGRAYAREMKAVAAVTHPRNVPSTDPARGLEVQGFQIAPDTLASLTTLDLKRARLPATDVLILDSTGSAADLQTAFEQAGARVKRDAFAGYDALMSEPTFSATPVADFARVAAWIGERTIAVPRAALSSQPATLVDADFIEEPVLFGPDQRLFGMLCRPRDERHATTLLFVNAGANPHIGWARSAVDSARDLARAGFYSFRIDVAGLGDSGPDPSRRGLPMYDLAVTADVNAAIDWLASQGLGRVALLGLCSGAHLAFHTALHDPRVTGLAIANLPRFIWPAGLSVEDAVRQAVQGNDHYRARAGQLSTWLRLVKGQITFRPIAAALLGRFQRALRSRIGRWVDPQHESNVVRGWVRDLSRRGTRLVFAFSQGDAGLDEIRTHWRGGKTPRIPGAIVVTIDNADHNFTPLEARQALTRAIADAFACERNATLAVPERFDAQPSGGRLWVSSASSLQA